MTLRLRPYSRLTSPRRFPPSRRCRRLAEEAFDDQCTSANPRYPLIADLKQIYLDAYNAPVLPIKTLDFFSKV